MRMNRTSIVLACLALGLPALVISQGKVVSTAIGEEGLLLSFEPGRYRMDQVSIDGQSMLFFPDAAGVAEGSQGLPVESFLIAVPPGVRPTLEILSEKVRDTRETLLAPIPTVTVSEDSLRTITYDFADPKGLPFTTITKPRIGALIHWRGYTLARVELSPFSYDPTTRILTSYDLIQIRVRFEGRSVPGASYSDRHFDDQFRSMVVNADQARGWRVQTPIGTMASATGDSTRDWFDPLKTYLKMEVARDGLFSLSYSEITSALGVTGPFPLGQVGIFFKGIRFSPLILGGQDGYFGPGDSLVFFGVKLRDRNGNADEYSDTSAYWLSLDAEPADPLRTDDGTLAASTDTMHSFRHTVRLEKDSIYFFGNGGIGLNNTSGKVFGEGWYWRRLTANQSRSFSFIVGNPDTTYLPLTLSGRIHSPIHDFNQPDSTHNLALRINGSLVGNILFDKNQDTTFSLPFAASLIQQGNNTLTVTSVPTTASLNEVYIDWLGIEVEEKPVAVSDSLFVTPDSSLANKYVLFSVTGFLSPDIIIIRLDPEGLMEKSITPSVSGPGPYTITFRDTVRSQRAYMLTTRAQIGTVAPLARKQFGDLRVNATGADYIVISHPEFLSAANQLASYRIQQGIGRAIVVSVDDIYDEFNFGHQSPIAIRSFLRAADSLWTAPAPAYVVLLGDANWDSKNNLNSSRRNLVPSYGNPVSDAFYAASAADGLLPEKFIGRLPVQTAEQASELVAHVIAYEAQPLSMWNKTFLFMSAGYTATETNRFQGFSDNLIAKYVEAMPVSGVGARIYRPPSNVIEFEVTDSIQRILDNGAVWMNFYGHSGTEIWANGISQPGQLVNSSGKRHLVSDISCSTVRFAEPLIEAFGERMILGGAGGAIGYLGSSGFGFESPLRIIADTMYARVARDTVRELGRMLFAAKVELWKKGLSSLNTQALDQFTLLGDPATRLAVATQPDYTMDQNQITVVPDQPTDSGPVSLHVPVLNYGLRGTDTVSISLTHTHQTVQTPLPQVAMPPVGASENLIITSDLFRKPGQHSLSMTVDVNAQLAESNEANNTVTFSFFVLSQQLLPLQPISFSVHHPDSVTLMFQNPNQALASSWNAFFQIDTVADFSSPGMISSPPLAQGVYSTQWSVPVGILQDSARYHWQARLSSGVEHTNWIGGEFYTHLERRATWYQDGILLIEANTTNHVMSGGSVRLVSSRKPVALHSAGFDAGDSAAIYVDGRNISLGLTDRGYNIAVLDPADASVEQFGAFRIYTETPDTSLVEPLIQFLEGIPIGRIVLIAIADEGAVNKTERLNQAIESVGSSMIRSLGFRSSWAIIGRKGAAIGSVPEMRKGALAGPVVLEDTVFFASMEGTVTTSFIGPSASWTDLTITADTSNPGARASFDLIRRFEYGSVDTVRNIAPGEDLSSIIPGTVRGIRLHARLASDSAGVSPFLTSWSVTFVPPPELGLNYQIVSTDKDSVLEGEEVVLTARIRNSGPTPAQNVLMQVSAMGNVLDSTRINAPASGEGIHTFIVGTAGFSGHTPFTIEIDPDDEIPEILEANNIMTISVFVQSDTIAPAFQVTFDGLRILEGDYVRPDPEIRVLIQDNSPLPITDPANVVLRLDGQRINLGSAPDSLFEPLPGPEKARVIVRPKLTRGPHTLSLQVLDATGNPADSVEYQLRFNVETSTRLLNVLNFPNPFSSETAFTFHLTGALPPDEVFLRIYTVAGRLIYERKYYPGQVNVGFNRIVWDGRDQNGDAVANGVYFYKVTAVGGGERVEVVEKVARVR